MREKLIKVNSLEQLKHFQINPLAQVSFLTKRDLNDNEPQKFEGIIIGWENSLSPIIIAEITGDKHYGFEKINLWKEEKRVLWGTYTKIPFEDPKYSWYQSFWKKAQDE